MNIVLISTYELGRQPFGLASPATWLRAQGHRVLTFDLTRETLDDAVIGAADLIAFYLSADRLPVQRQWSRKHAHTQRRLCERFAAPVIGAVVCQRPLIDMLRYTHFGAGASWIGEYGDPADPAMRAAILKYSPYENLKPGVKYPPVLFITETSDDRVTPVFARMMAAKMEAMKQDVLFYESLEGGHGPGATHEEQAQMWALSYVYLAQKLGLREGVTPRGRGR